MTMALLPPFVVNVRVRQPNSRGFHLWLPLFLLWPLLALILIPALVISVAVDLVLFVLGARYHHYTVLLVSLLGLLAEVRGTHAHVSGDDSSIVDVDIY